MLHWCHGIFLFSDTYPIFSFGLPCFSSLTHTHTHSLSHSLTLYVSIFLQFDATEDVARPVLEKEVVEGNKAVLPPTWRIMEEDGMVFFFNVETRKAQWDAPIIKTAVAAQPAKWKELTDDYI